MPEDKPSLRPIEAVPVEQDGRTMIVLSDPSGLSDASLAVSPGALVLMQLMDGSNDLRDIQAAFFRQTMQLVPMEQIEELVHTLEEAFLLEGERHVAERAAQEAAYLSLKHRPAAMAGASYPDEPGLLARVLDELCTDPAGPGAPPGGPPDDPPTVRAVVAPHIDYTRGGAAYAHAYRALAEGSSARLVVVFGTAHGGCDGHVALTRKGYDTPLGTLPCDVELVEEVARRGAGERWFAGETAHRGEHSIEFQAVWLRHVLPHEDVRIVPILCGSLHRWVEEGGLPDEDAEVADLVGALRGAIEDRGEPFVVVAGADLAHIGPRFGDPAPPDDARLELLARQDAETLDHVCRGDADAFFRDVASDGDARRICGLSAIYLTLKVAAPVSGEVLRYGQAEDPTGPSTVSFAAVTLG